MPRKKATHPLPYGEWSGVMRYFTDKLNLPPNIRSAYEGPKFKVDLWNRSTYKGKLTFYTDGEVDLKKGKRYGASSFSVDTIRKLEKVRFLIKNKTVYEGPPPPKIPIKFNSKQIA